jgi:hypothetical protein
MRATDPFKQFFAYIEFDAASGCWNWTGGIDKGGYGVYRSRNAHRFIFAHSNGWGIPTGKWVLHRCDNRKCVNPRHLFLGTRQDNVDDMHAKGRARKAKGEEVGNARLTAMDVVAIRQDLRTQSEIAKDYGIARSTVSAIKTKQNWAHV